MNRRWFLRQGAALAALFGLQSLRGSRARTPDSRAIGLQLYTVIPQLERDFEGTLAAVSRIGYTEVETMGAFGRDPAFVREALARFGLKSPSQHIVSPALYDIVKRSVIGELSGPETVRLLTTGLATGEMTKLVEEAIETAKALGQQNVVWPACWKPQIATREAQLQFADALNRAGKACAKAGLKFGFHNHGEELVAVDGVVPYDVLLENTDPREVLLEMDVYWMRWGKKSPIEYLQRYGGRYAQLHLKDARSDGKFAAMGAGVIDFPPILAAARKAGVGHFYVEQNSPTDALGAIATSFSYLHSHL
jgi:sugar phosphate isomerase/epimerase